MRSDLGIPNLFREPLFPDPLPGRFIRRLNRFVIECECDGRVVQAHLPNPGRLWELLVPGRTVTLAKNAAVPGRAMPYTAVAVERDGVMVLLHTAKANEVVQFLLASKSIPGLEGAEIVRREFALGGSRFDFLLRENGEEILLEVKSCTLYGKSLAMFPDAVSARGRRHLEELAAHAQNGRRSGVIFLIHSPRPEFFLPDYHTDYEFARTFQKRRDRIFYRALRVSWTADLRLDEKIETASIPWPLLERENQDRGCYLLLMHLAAAARIAVGALGEIDFPAGHYLYAGSAKKALTARLARHLRKGGKNLHWHVDYLREEAASCRALAIRTRDDLECELAAAANRIAAHAVFGFGASDCSCPSHLFFLGTRPPLQNQAFLDLLQCFRMDRLAPEREKREF
ncbi:MAG: DNA/RNA nuclease SfsA [Pseudomonadota bacterium]|nr:DNA/RNA nuclease SfsA [Pseudomonadota bacterium]